MPVWLYYAKVALVAAAFIVFAVLAVKSWAWLAEHCDPNIFLWGKALPVAVSLGYCDR